MLGGRERKQRGKKEKNNGDEITCPPMGLASGLISLRPFNSDCTLSEVMIDRVLNYGRVAQKVSPGNGRKRSGAPRLDVHKCLLNYESKRMETATECGG